MRAKFSLSEKGIKNERGRKTGMNLVLLDQNQRYQFAFMFRETDKLQIICVSMG